MRPSGLGGAHRRLSVYRAHRAYVPAMEPYPHHYRVEATVEADGPVTITAHGLPPLVSAPPVPFGGPGDRWSPEELLVAAVADCFLLTFRAIARASRLTWRRLACRAEGVLDRAGGVTRFTQIHLHARLVVPSGEDLDRARRLLEKAERGCLVSRSLAFDPALHADVVAE